MRTGYKNARFTDNIGVFDPDRLFAGEQELLRHTAGKIQIPNLKTLLRGTLMGRVFGAEGAAASAAPGNTGNTTFAAAPSAANPFQLPVGRYVIRCTTAGAAGAARYTVYRAGDGRQVANGLQSGTGTNVLGLTVTPTHGSDNPVVGDTWTLRVRALRWARVNPKATDGSQIPAGILVQEVADVAGDRGSEITGDANHRQKDGHIYTQGVFAWPTVDLATEGFTSPEDKTKRVAAGTTAYDHGFELEDIAEQLNENSLVLLDSIQDQRPVTTQSTDRSDWI